MKQKNIVITGGARGIGAACVRLFAQKGWNVAFTFNKSNAEADALLSEIRPYGGMYQALQCDVADFKAVQNVFLQVSKTFGALDALVNNAGIALEKLFIDTTESDWDRIMVVNAKGVFNCCKAAVPIMLDKKSGKIINISSMWGQVGASCEVAYSASKAAVIGFTKALAKELGPSNILVNCIAPGVISTDMTKELGDETLQLLKEETPLCRIGMPEDIAEAVYYLASGGGFITGQVLGVNGGFVI